ncbi:MAG: alpha/beta hydrolase [Phycisphaerae bacterium]|nr:alpha/beta hydrolase [Gemmatimonadaceae bacterium]
MMIRNRSSALLALLFAACAGDARNAADTTNVSRDSTPAGTTAPSVPSTIAKADIPGGRLWYEIAGQGEPVILVHGGNLDARMWDVQFALLARTNQVVRYDLRGFGRSTNADSAFSAHDDLYALMNALKIPRASIVGLSLGGRVAMDLAVAHPEMVARLALAGPGLSGWAWDVREHPDTMWLKAARAAGQRGDTAAVGLAWLESDFMRPSMEQAALQPQLRALSTANVRLWSRFLRGADAEIPANPGAFAKVGALKVPTLLIVGSRDVPEIHRIVDSLAVKIPGARRVAIEGAGHMVNMERPVQFNEALLAFLKQ